MTPLTVTQFQTYFARNFVYGTVLPAVLDGDITNAINEAMLVFNPDIYPDDNTATTAALYLSAHFLQTALDMADSQGQPDAIENSRSANGVSQSLVVPDWMQEGELAMYATTGYGRRWLLITKQFVDGAVFVIGGAVQP